MKTLTVDKFLREIVEYLELPPLKKGTRFVIRFSDEESQFKINFEKNYNIHTVYKRITDIEAIREELSGKISPRSEKRIIAEIEMIRTFVSES